MLGQPLSPAQLLMLQIEENDGDNRQDISCHDLVRAVAPTFELEGPREPIRPARAVRSARVGVEERAGGPGGPPGPLAHRLAADCQPPQRPLR